MSIPFFVTIVLGMLAATLPGASLMHCWNQQADLRTRIGWQLIIGGILHMVLQRYLGTAAVVAMWAVVIVSNAALYWVDSRSVGRSPVASARNPQVDSPLRSAGNIGE
jgi:oxalate decarboxylase/phosphoglucose isomerase-like protein (cupin superfamily)